MGQPRPAHGTRPLKPVTGLRPTRLLLVEPIEPDVSTGIAKLPPQRDQAAVNVGAPLRSLPDWTTRYETAVVLATALADPSISEPDQVNLTAFEPSRKFPAGHAGTDHMALRPRSYRRILPRRGLPASTDRLPVLSERCWLARPTVLLQLRSTVVVASGIVEIRTPVRTMLISSSMRA
jgi:hypothetical protein